MVNRFGSVVVLIGGFFLSSCADKVPVELEKKEEVVPDKMVARVASVNKEAEYVLIQRFGRLIIPEDSVMYTLGGNTHDGGEAASIKFTGEKLGQFLAADIISGELKVGDPVYLRTFDKNAESDSQDVLINKETIKN